MKGHLCPECGEIRFCCPQCESGECWVIDGKALPAIYRCPAYGCRLDWRDAEGPEPWLAARNIYPGLVIGEPEAHPLGYWQWLVWQAFRSFELLERL